MILSCVPEGAGGEIGPEDKVPTVSQELKNGAEGSQMCSNDHRSAGRAMSVFLFKNTRVQSSQKTVKWRPGPKSTLCFGQQDLI